MSQSQTEGAASGTGKASGFDPTKGFVVINNTGWNIYLQRPTNTISQTPTNLNPFEKIPYPYGQTSTVQTATGNFPVRVDDNTSAPVLLTVQVDPNTGGVKIMSGTRRGSVAVGVHFC